MNTSGSEYHATTLKAAVENHETYRYISFLLAWLTLALCIFGVIGNTCSMIIYSHTSMRSPVNELLRGTAFIDFALSILSIPTFVIPGMYAYSKHRVLGVIVAYVSAYIYPLNTMMQSGSCWAFVVITFERWNTVCRPFQSSRSSWSSIPRSRVALGIVCVLAVAYNAIRFFEFQLGTEMNELNETEVIVDPYLRNNTNYLNIYYISMFLVTHFAIPFPILVVLNGFIIRTICESRQRRRQLNKKERSEHRTAIMMIIVVVTFICCYTLLFILNILEAADPDFFYANHVALAFALNDISNVLVVTNSASTIVVYYFFSQKYRQLLTHLVAKICKTMNYIRCNKTSLNTTSSLIVDRSTDRRPKSYTRSGNLGSARIPLLDGQESRKSTLRMNESPVLAVMSTLPGGKLDYCTDL